MVPGEIAPAIIKIDLIQNRSFINQNSPNIKKKVIIITISFDNDILIMNNWDNTYHR
jgi:AAA15 family ATPase/GTPase